MYSFDHYGSALTCDPNFDYETIQHIEFMKGRSSLINRCMYGKGIEEIELEYLTQFWEKYPDVRKFFRTSFQHAHEPMGDLIKYLDNTFVNFFQSFYDKGYLNDTQVVFVSDHGAHFLTLRTPIFPDDSRVMENALPVLFHLTPRSISEKNLELLRENQQKFTNSHDVYATLKSLAEGKVSSSPYVTDYSYLHESLPKGRDVETNI